MPILFKKNFHTFIKSFLGIFLFSICLASFSLPTPVFATSESVSCDSTTLNQTTLDALAGDVVTFTDGGDGICIFTGTLSAASVTVNSGVTLTHNAEGFDKDSGAGVTMTGVEITTTGDFTVNSGGAINVDTKGCQNAGAENGYGPNGSNACVISTAGYGDGLTAWVGVQGAGHGGVGGLGSTTTVNTGGLTYDSATAPILFGSSGGAADFGATGGAGGGLVNLSISGIFTNNGSISAAGGAGVGNPASSAAGGGSGGSIYITANTIGSTDGTFSANGGAGGNGDTDGGGGGGGRISITYTSLNLDPNNVFDITNFAVTGGSGPDTAIDGSVGSVYVKNTYDNSVNVYYGFTYAADYSVSSWTVDSTAVSQYCDGSVDPTPSITASTIILKGTLDCTNSLITGFDLSPSSALTMNGFTFSLGATDILTVNDAVPVVLTNTTTINSNVQWTNLSSLQIDSGSSINANSKGCQSIPVGTTLDGYGPNVSNVCVQGTAEGNTGGWGDGGDFWAGAQGAGHGGIGGLGDTPSLNAGGLTYDSATAPVLFGSSGGSANAGTVSVGGHGGGVVRLSSSGTFTNNGFLSVDGGVGGAASSAGGGGSGGSIYVTAATITGTNGTFSADGGAGGNSDSNGGGGGGGRIAFEYGTDSTTYLATLAAATVTVGGSGPDTADDGAVGTLSKVQTVSLTSITITDNSGYTYDSTPQIDIVQSGATPTDIAFSCNGGSNWSAWISYPVGNIINSGDAADFNITTGATGCSATNELKTISAKIRDGSSTSSTVSDTTTYDTAAPTVSTVSATNVNGTYGATTVINVTVQFTENMVVTGTPRFLLDFNGTDRNANYASVSTDTLTFTYTIVNGDNKTDLDYVATNSLTLGGDGIIKDRAGNFAVLTLATPGAAGSLGANKNINISTNQAPTVASVTGTQGTNGTGDVTITFIMDDADDDTTLQSLVQYNIGAGWNKATISETGADTSSTYGDPNVENDNTYQVGNATAYITSASGANTVTTVWNSAVDVPTANLTTAQIRITPYDGIEIGSTSTSSNFTLDNVDPSGLASLASSADTSTTITLGWTAGSDTNFDHYEIWYGTNTTDVSNRTGTAVEWDNSDDADLATAATADTVITGLTGAQTYYLKIWAIDDYGNSSTLSTITVNNNGLPTVASVTGAQGTNGTGDVTVTFIMDDPNDDNTLQAKIEYSLNGGSTWADPTISTTNSETTATYGDPSVNNAVTYQVGQAGAYITSASGANTVSIVWEAATDILGTIDISNAKIRVTPYDGTEAGVAASSSNHILDVVDPTGLASFTQTDYSTNSINLAWTAAADTNFDHYEIWYGSSTDVAARSGTAVEWDNSDTANLGTATTASTVITGMDPRGKYMKIFAVDDFGNESTLAAYQVQSNQSSSSSSGGGGGSSGGSSSHTEDTTVTNGTATTDGTSEETNITTGTTTEGSICDNTNTVDETVTDEIGETADDEVTQTFWEQHGWEVPDHWSSGYVKYLEEDANVVEVAVDVPTFTEILDGIFKNPDNPMPRGQALELLIALAGYQVESVSFNVRDLIFSDVSVNDPRVGFIQFAYEHDLITGYPDGTFQPERTVNRAEALKLAAYFFRKELDSTLRGTELLAAYGLTGNPFSDLDLTQWYAPYVVYAYSHGVISGYGDGTFGPANPVTFAEFLKISTLMQNAEDAIQLAEDLECL